MLTIESKAEKDLAQSETRLKKGRLQKDSTTIGEGLLTAYNRFSSVR